MFHFRAIELLVDGGEHVIDDSRRFSSGPFELLIGREFKISIWEKWVKEMMIGEIARFICPFKVG